MVFLNVLQTSILQEVQKLLARRADPNAILENGDTPLHVYVKEDRYDCLLSLLIHYDPESLEINHPAEMLNTPLHVAAQVCMSELE